MNRNGPRMISAESFWVLMTPNDTPAKAGFDFLRRLAEESLEESNIPRRMWAWVAEAGGWRLLFHGSVPAMARWAEDELPSGVGRFTTLTDFVWAVHDSDTQRDEVHAFLNYEPEYLQVVEGRAAGLDGPLDAPSDDAAAHAGENAVWALVRRHTGLTLADVQDAIGRGRAALLVRKRKLVEEPGPLLRDADGWKVMALVLRLAEISALPHLLRVCRDLAVGADAHLPAEEYLRWTFVITHQDHVGQRKLPPEDPSMPAETTDYVPGLCDGIMACLEALPAWYDVVAPSDGMAHYVAEAHVSEPVEAIVEHLRARGFTVLRAKDLLASASNEEAAAPDVEARVRAWLEQAPSVYAGGVVPDGDAVWYDHVRGRSVDTAGVVATRTLLESCPALGRHPAIWNDRDRRIAELLVAHGAAHRLVLGDDATPSWLSPEEAWHDAWVEAMERAGMPREQARRAIARGVVSYPRLSLANALWVLCRRTELRAMFGDDADERAGVERAITRALETAKRELRTDLVPDIRPPPREGSAPAAPGNAVGAAAEVAQDARHGKTEY